MKKIFAFNLKNNLIDNVNLYLKNFKSEKSKKVIFCPNTLQLINFKDNKDEDFEVGLQNVFELENKSITGEVDINLAKQLKVKYCLVGHSERRLFLNETDKQINEKIGLLLKNKIIPILCVGELKLMNDKSTFKFIEKQILSAVNNFKNIIIAYEPVYSIGTGKACKSEHIEKVCSFIKEKFNPKYVLYGGSVNEENISELSLIENIDGYLIGKASLDMKKVIEIIKRG